MPMHLSKPMLLAWTLTRVMAAQGQEYTVDLNKPCLITGTVAPKQELSLTLHVKAGKTMQMLVTKGAKEVVAEIDDPQGIMPNEGADDEEWFFVSPGKYTLRVLNMTHIGTKTNGRSAAFSIKVVVK